METDNTNLFEAFISGVKGFSESSQSLETNTLSEIFQLVQDVYTCTNNDFRKQREAQLATLRTSAEWTKYVLHLFQILSFSEISKKEILERVGFEISSVIEKRVNSATISPEELLILISANIYCLLNKDFSVKISNHLAKALKNLFKFQFNERDSLQKVIEKYVISLLGEATSAQSCSISLILRQLVEIQCNESLEYERIQTYLQAALNLGIARLERLPDLLQNIEANTQDFGFSLEIIYCCMDICTLIFKKVSNPKSTVSFSQDQKKQFDQFLIFQNNELIQQALVFTEKVLSLDLNNSGIKLISINTLNNVDGVLNKGKKLAVKNASCMFNYIYNFKSPHKVALSEYEANIFQGYVNNFSEFLKFFLTQLHTIIVMSYSSNTKFSVEHQEILRESIALLREMVGQYEYYDLFLSNRVEITLDIVLNLLLTTQVDYKYLKEDPRDFTSFEQDLIEEGLSDNLKVNTVQFFMRYCEKVDGTLSWFTALILKVIKVSLNQNEDYEELRQYQGSLFFSAVDSVNRIETSLLCLVILTKQMINREDLIKDLDRFFISDFKLLFSVDSEIVKCRICLFMKQMIPSLFQRNQIYFKESLKYLFECSIDFNNAAVSYQALSAIESISDKEGSQYERVEIFIDDMLIYLYAMIEKAEEEPYFDFLQTVLTDYEELSFQFGAEIIKRLCSRTWNEFQSLTETKRTNLVITKCLETIRSMTASQDIMDAQFVQFEDDLQDLFTLLDAKHRIDFDDGLLSIVTEVAKNVSLNTAVFQIVKRNMVKVLENNNYRFDLFFELFEYWCINGHKFILEEDPELLVEMVKVCLVTIEAFPVKRIKNDYETFSMAAVSLQLIIQSFGEEDISAIIPGIVEVFSKTLKNLTSDCDAIGCFRLLQVYYCLIYYCTADTLKLLRDNTLLQLLAIQVPTYYINYFKYDNLSRKIITLGLNAILFNRNLLNLDHNFIEGTFLNLIRILGNTPGLQRTTKNTIIGQQIEELETSKQEYFTLDPSETNDIEISAANIVSQDKRLSELLKRMTFPLAESDEFRSFGEIFKLIKQEHPDIIQTFVQTFDKETIQKFEDILMTKNFPSGDFNRIETRRNVTVKKFNKMTFE